MNRAGLIDLVRGSALPAALRTYLGRVLAADLPWSLREELKKDPEGFIAGVGGLLREAGLALGCGGDRALLMNGFDVNNLAPDRLEAALAELLAVVFLGSAGFSGLRFIPRGRGLTADFSAERGGAVYAFEVCSARAPGADLSVDFLELKYDKKIRQARVSGRKGRMDRCGFVLVAGTPVFTGFGRDKRLAALAAGLYERKNRPRGTHICCSPAARPPFTRPGAELALFIPELFEEKRQVRVRRVQPQRFHQAHLGRFLHSEFQVDAGEAEQGGSPAGFKLYGGEAGAGGLPQPAGGGVRDAKQVKSAGFFYVFQRLLEGFSGLWRVAELEIDPSRLTSGASPVIGASAAF